LRFTGDAPSDSCSNTPYSEYIPKQRELGLLLFFSWLIRSELFISGFPLPVVSRAGMIRFFGRLEDAAGLFFLLGYLMWIIPYLNGSPNGIVHYHNKSQGKSNFP